MRNKKISFIAAIFIAVTLIISGFTRDQKLFQLNKNLDIYYSVIRELNSFYVDGIKPEKLIRTSIDDMLSTLDPYTNYIPESEMSNFKFMTDGEYAGIGAIIGKHNKDIIISEPYEGFPAQKAGLKAGDIIKEIDGKSTENMTTEQVSNHLKGKPDEIVHIKIQRPGKKKIIELNIIREKVQLDPIPYKGMLKNKTGYIRLSNFWEGCGDEVKKTFIELKNQGAQRIILDLRSNPGGLLNEAVKIVNIFVPKGSEVVNTRGKMKQWDNDYKATEDPIDTIMPIAVLVNRGSASASEIVSGSLQDQDRAVIIGTRTFGKGLVQTTRNIPYNGVLKVTTAKYYIPSGRCIQAIDYSNRNEDGSVGRIPDSLTTEFSTRAGRKVRDGGGIQPDIECKDDRGASISYYLMEGYYFFDYANRYYRKHEKIAPIAEFKISDADYADFLEFVKSRNFTYDSQSKKAFNKLKEVLDAEKYADDVKSELDSLGAKLNRNLDADFATSREEIELLLSTEIVSRYYYQSGEMQQSLKFDPCLKKAIEVLNDPEMYRQTLISSSVKN